MARPRDEVVRWMVQYPDYMTRWSNIAPEHHSESTYVLAYGWRSGKITWRDNNTNE